MRTKTMKGLVGAKTNMNLMNTPMRVYKEARQKGDSETMKGQWDMWANVLTGRRN